MFVDLDWPLNASSLLSASAELLVELYVTAVWSLDFVLQCLHYSCASRVELRERKRGRSWRERGSRLENRLDSDFRSVTTVTSDQESSSSDACGNRAGPPTASRDRADRKQLAQTPTHFRRMCEGHDVTGRHREAMWTMAERRATCHQYFRSEWQPFRNLTTSGCRPAVSNNKLT